MGNVEKKVVGMETSFPHSPPLTRRFPSGGCVLPGGKVQARPAADDMQEMLNTCNMSQVQICSKIDFVKTTDSFDIVAGNKGNITLGVKITEEVQAEAHCLSTPAHLPASTCPARALVVLL